MDPTVAYKNLEKLSLEKYRFFEIFKLRLDGNLEAKVPVNINGLSLYPGRTIRFIDNIDLLEYADRDIAIIKRKDGILEYKGFYKKSEREQKEASTY